MHTLLRSVRFSTRSHPTVPRHFGSCKFYSIMADSNASARVDKKPKDNGTREVKILMLHGKMSLPGVLQT